MRYEQIWVELDSLSVFSDFCPGGASQGPVGLLHPDAMLWAAGAMFGPRPRPRAEFEARDRARTALPWSLPLSWNSTRTSASICTATASVRHPPFHAMAGTSAVRHISVKQGVWKEVTSSCAQGQSVAEFYSGQQFKMLPLCQDNGTLL